MDFYSAKKPANGSRYGLGFKSSHQLPLIMIWREWWNDGEVTDARVIYSSFKGSKA